METKRGKGWFVFTVSALASGDAEALMDPYNLVDLKGIRSTCVTLSISGFATRSRRGWQTIRHPDLGTLQWKFGFQVGTALEYFFLRLDGRLLVRAWPKMGSKVTYAEWVSKESGLARDYGERALGTLQGGTQLSPERRNEKLPYIK